MNPNGKYDEIMGLAHHVSKTRPQMPMADRAAQFAPYAALTGYDAVIRETGRLTDARIEPDEEALTALNMKFRLLMDALGDAPEITLLVFRPDTRKAGGAYLTVTGRVRKVDEYARLMTLQDGTKIPMDDILDMTGALFSPLESRQATIPAGKRKRTKRGRSKNVLKKFQKKVDKNRVIVYHIFRRRARHDQAMRRSSSGA